MLPETSSGRNTCQVKTWRSAAACQPRWRRPFVRIACDGLVTSQGWTTPGCQSRSCLRRALTRGPAMDPSVVGEMWQLQTCVRPVSRRRNGTTLLRTGGTGANVAVGSHQASPNQECSSVSAAATFAARMIYPDTRTTASPNSYHRLRRWAFQRSKGVCVCVCMCECVCV